MSLAGIAENLVWIIVAIAQILSARLFQSEWKQKLPGWARRPVEWSLWCVWSITAVEILLSVFTKETKTPWVPSGVRSLLEAVGVTWGVSTAASLTIYYLCRWMGKRWVRERSAEPEFSPVRRRLVQTAGAVAVASPFVFTGLGALIERTNFEIKELDFPVPDLHPDFEGFRLAQISDLHVSPFLSVRDAARVVDMTNELRPHLTVMTGDLITRPGDPLDATIRELGRLRADLGVLGCLGNHERFAECEGYTTAEAARYGVDFLRMRAREVKWGAGSLNIAGVDFQPFRDRALYLQGSERLVRRGMPNLLLSHNPDVFPVAVAKGYDAVLAGHTHAGQVNFEILSQHLNFARFITPFVAGLYRLEGRSCYVTAGIGTIAMPVRVGAPPEITLLRLKRA